MAKKNTLADLNDHLFQQLDRLANSTGDELKIEIERTRAMAGMAKEMTDNARLALEAYRTVGSKADTPEMLQIGGE